MLSFSPGTEFDQDWLLRRIEPLGYQEPTPGGYHIGQPVYSMEIIDRSSAGAPTLPSSPSLMDVGVAVFLAVLRGKTSRPSALS